MKGSRVLTCSRNSGDLEKCVEEWKSQGFDVTGVQADVSSAEGRDALMSEIRSWLDGKESLEDGKLQDKQPERMDTEWWIPWTSRKTSQIWQVG